MEFRGPETSLVLGRCAEGPPPPSMSTPRGLRVFRIEGLGVKGKAKQGLRVFRIQGLGFKGKAKQGFSVVVGFRV